MTASPAHGGTEVAPLLGRGPHRHREDGACVMEYVAWLAGEPHTDRPACVHPLLAAVTQIVNDAIGPSARTTLARQAPEFIGTATEDPVVWHAIVQLVCGDGMAVAPSLWTAQLHHALKTPARRFQGVGFRARMARRRSESAVRAATAAIVITAPRGSDKWLLQLVQDGLTVCRPNAPRPAEPNRTQPTSRLI